MTTGRINQVTIVRLGCRPTARFTGRKRYLVTWTGGHGARAPRSSPGTVAVARRWAHPLSPSEFPRALSAGGSGALRAPEHTT
jgi:hypothetical protein